MLLQPLPRVEIDYICTSLEVSFTSKCFTLNKKEALATLEPSLHHAEGADAKASLEAD